MNMKGSRLSTFALFLFVQLLPGIGFAQNQQKQMPDLIPLPQTGKLSQPANPEKFTFVVAGDNRPGKSKDKTCSQPAQPGKIFDAVKSTAASFVLWTGDTIAGKKPDPGTLQAEYKEFFDLAARAGVPVFNAPGNHELDDSDDCPDDGMKQLYVTNINVDNKPSVFTYGAFTYGNSRFIALDSENEPPGVACMRKVRVPSTAEAEKSSGAPGAIPADQLTLLKADLEAAKRNNLKHVFIFMHHPVDGYGGTDGLDPNSAKWLKDLLAQYQNISYVLSGHQHMYDYEALKPRTARASGAHPPTPCTPSPHPKKTAPTCKNPPPRTDPSKDLRVNIISGGGGAPLRKDSIFHYLKFTVDGATVTPEVVPIAWCASCKNPDSCDACSNHGKCTVFAPKSLQ